MPYDRVVVIFNPQSTGDAPRLAEELRADLTGRLRDAPVEMSPTQHAGHARDLARQAARTGRPLIISVSGDGGYNEVVDGLMQAANPHAAAAVMAAGNANDHRRTTRERPIADAVVAGQVRRIDLLRLTIGSGMGARTRYAHSYIGIGLTPVVAIDLEKGGKGSLKEIASVVRTSPGSGPSPSSWRTAGGAASTACSSRTSPRWPSTPPSARQETRPTASSR
jgi:diacylglycerol kinase family enzyme